MNRFSLNKKTFLGILLALTVFGGVLVTPSVTSAEPMGPGANDVVRAPTAKPSGEQVVTKIDCGWTYSPQCWVGQLLYYVVYTTFGTLVTVSALVFNYITQISILEFPKWAGLSGIRIAWTVLRDVLNITFIFLLLYAAISMILGLGKEKGIVKGVITAGLLINFSFFFTSVIIDVSNVFTVEMYNTIIRIGEKTSGFVSDDSVVQANGITSVFMNGLGIKQGISKPTAGADYDTHLLMNLIFSSITMLVVAFVFFAMGLLFLVRFLILIVLLITSPISVMGGLLPQLKKQADDWWDALLGQAIFAPVMMLFLVITTVVISAKDFRDGFHAADVGGVTVPLSGTIEGLIQYGIVIGLLIMSIVIAKKTAGSAAKGMMGWATGAAGGLAFGAAARAGRATLGRAGAAISERGDLNAAAARGGLGGLAAKGLISGGKWTGNKSFDVRGIDAVGKEAGAGKPIQGFTKNREEAKKAYAGYLKKANEGSGANPEKERIASVQKNLATIKTDANTQMAEAQQRFNGGEIGRAELEAIQQKQKERVINAEKETKVALKNPAKEELKSAQKEADQAIQAAKLDTVRGKISYADLEKIEREQREKVHQTRLKTVTTESHARKEVSRASRNITTDDMRAYRAAVEASNKAYDDTNGTKVAKEKARKDTMAAELNQMRNKDGVMTYKLSLERLKEVKDANEKNQKATQERLAGEMTAEKTFTNIGARDAADDMRKELGKSGKDKAWEEIIKQAKEAEPKEEGVTTPAATPPAAPETPKPAEGGAPTA